MTNYAFVILPARQEWPSDLQRDFQFASVAETTDGIQIPPHCSFTVGGHSSHGFGGRVLTIRTNGNMIEDGIRTAETIATRRGLGPSRVALSPAELSRIHDEMDYPDGLPSWLNPILR